MKKIGNTIIEEGITVDDSLKSRITVRAVILKDNEVLMIYSKKFNDYIFPGGGIKENESLEDALKRELYEELGANKVTIIKGVGYTEELRHGISGSDSVYNQKSYYYICNIEDIGKPNFVGREKEDDLTAFFKDIDEVILHNELILKDYNHQQKGFKTVLTRENRILKYVKEYIL